MVGTKIYPTFNRVQYSGLLEHLALFFIPFIFLHSVRHENFSQSVLCRYSASRIFASVSRPVYLQAPAARASYRDCFRETAACSREQYAVTAYASNVRGMSTAHCAMTLRAPGPLDTCGPQELRGRVSANRCESSRSALVLSWCSPTIRFVVFWHLSTP